MNGKFCKNNRCSGAAQGVCSAWEDCCMFQWDVERQIGKVEEKKDLVPREDEEQTALYAWCKENHIKMIHIPNERKCSKIVGHLLSEQGVQKGFPDNFFPYPCNGVSGLFIELKRRKRSLSHVSKEQKRWNEFLNDAGYKAVICYGAEQAIEEIKIYLGKK